MTVQTRIYALRLRAEIALWRHGWGVVVVFALLALSGTALLMQQHWVQAEDEAQLRLKKLSAEIETVQRQLPVVPKSTPEQERHALLRTVLSSQEGVTPLVRDVFAQARQHGLIVKEAEFRLTAQGFAGLQQQQVLMPLQGTYPAFRSFVNDLLRSQPGVSVDQIQIKRAAVAQGAPEIQVRLSIWIDPLKRDAGAQGEVR